MTTYHVDTLAQATRIITGANGRDCAWNSVRALFEFFAAEDNAARARSLPVQAWPDEDAPSAWWLAARNACNGMVTSRDRREFLIAREALRELVDWTHDAADDAEVTR